MMSKVRALVLSERAVNAVLLIALLALPYYLFQGKWFIGGDDTRLSYVYPIQYLQHIAYFVWTSFSSLNNYNSNHFAIPFLLVTYLIHVIIPSDTVVIYFLFSLPLIIGFFSFQKLMEVLLNTKIGYEKMLGGLIYVLSPITIVHQLSIFLVTVWLFALIPLLAYFYICFLKSGKFKYILLAVLSTTLLSIGLIAVPWAFGVLLPLLAASCIIIFFYSKKELILFVRRTLFFSLFVLLSQLFWLLPFLGSFFEKNYSSFSINPFSTSVVESYQSIVLATAIGNVIYPLLLLPNRFIAFSYNWQIVDAFTKVYDKTFFLNFVFLLVIFIALLFYKKALNMSQKKLYLLFLLSMSFSLFLLVVNIGFLKDFFLFLVRIPGFAMFRNFYDKFALSFIFFYSITFSFSLYSLRKILYKKWFMLYRFLIIGLFAIVFINTIPIKSIVNTPLWNTKNTYRTIVIPDEYVRFMQDVEQRIERDSIVIALPLNIASYAIIQDETSKNVYVGTSPIKILTGLTNVSGFLSLPESEYLKLQKLLAENNYKGLLTLLKRYNIEYLIFQKGIQKDVLNSYLFAADGAYNQNEKMVRALTLKLLHKSFSGTYSLYKTKVKNDLDSKVVYKYINPVKYKVFLKNIDEKTILHLDEPFNTGWKVYVSSNNEALMENSVYYESNLLRDVLSLKYLFKKNIGEGTHIPVKNFSNSWTIEKKDLEGTLGKGKLENIELEIYFRPQLYFYLGTLLSIVNMGLIFYLYYHEKKKS